MFMCVCELFVWVCIYVWCSKGLRTWPPVVFLCVVNCLCGVCLYVVCLRGLKNDRRSPFLWACELFVWVFPGKRLYKLTFTRHTKTQPTRTSYEKVTKSGWGNCWSSGVRKATSTPCGRQTATTTSRKPRQMRLRASAFRRRWLRHVFLLQVFCLEYCEFFIHQWTYASTKYRKCCEWLGHAQTCRAHRNP